MVPIPTLPDLDFERINLLFPLHDYICTKAPPNLDLRVLYELVRKGEVFAYVGLPQIPKDLKDLQKLLVYSVH